MFKRNFAAIVVTALLATAGYAQASSPFPSATEEGPEYSVNGPLTVTTAGLRGADSVFPSAAREGGEHGEQYAGHTTPRNLERSYAGGHGNVFPSTAME